MLIYLSPHRYISKNTLSIHSGALRKKKSVEAYDELQTAKLMKYFGFQTEEELLDFLKYEHIQY